MRRLLPVFLLVLASTPAWAQLKLKLEFPSPGTRSVWIGAELPKGKLPAATTIEGTSGEFEPEAFGPSDKLFVLDSRTGNLAMKPMSEVSGSWKLAESDFSKVGMVRVRVEHKGLPVESAGVALTAGKQSQSMVIDSASAGEALFFGIPPGQVQVAVTYKTKDGDSPEPIKQSSAIPLRRGKPEAMIIISIPDEVATVAVSQSEEVKKAQQESAQEEQGGGGLFGKLVSFLIAVGVAAVAVWFGLKLLKANQDKVQDKLSSLGVEIPKPGEPSTDAQAAVQAPIAPPPPAQILLDDAAPTALSTPVAATPAEILSPRLVSSDGDSLQLEEGTLTVGRDAGMGLSLITETTVSRNHAEIIREGASVKVKDLGSTNGTFVNGVQVTGETELRPGDQVQFGAVRFRFEG